MLETHVRWAVACAGAIEREGLDAIHNVSPAFLYVVYCSYFLFMFSNACMTCNVREAQHRNRIATLQQQASVQQ